MTIYPALAEMKNPLEHFEQVRARVLSDVVEQTRSELLAEPGSLDLLLGEALYLERIRLKRASKSIFVRKRIAGDRRLWGYVQNGLLKSPGESDRRLLLKAVMSHYAEEIGGHFDPKVYQFATGAVPWGFNWVFNAASVGSLLPSKHTQQLNTRLRITGEIERLRNLAAKGTVLLVPTHQSNIDSVLIGYIIYLLGLPPFAYGAGLNLFSNPVLSYFMSNLGSYTVDRSKSNAIYKNTLKNYSARILQEGIHSIFFPGGGRSRSGAIESKLKLGLLGTALQAQLSNLQRGAERSSIYIVPMSMSYHFVLEASSLIEDYLMEAGKHRFIISDDEFSQLSQVARFFWKFFASSSEVSVRVGAPMDVFGNEVDENGESIGPNGTRIDPRQWLTTRGELRPEPARDQEYTRELGQRIVQRFYSGNTVLDSHLLAFAFFEALRKQYPDLDLYRFLRLSLAQRSLSYERFVSEAQALKQKVIGMARAGTFHLCQELQRNDDTDQWIRSGIRKLGIFHGARVLMVRDGEVTTEDMNLLYYYRNRLTGYGISLRADPRKSKPGSLDDRRFLA